MKLTIESGSMFPMDDNTRNLTPEQRWAWIQRHIHRIDSELNAIRDVIAGMQQTITTLNDGRCKEIDALRTHLDEISEYALETLLEVFPKQRSEEQTSELQSRFGI